MDAIREAMPPVPDGLGNWDCDLGRLDSFDFGLDLDLDFPSQSFDPESHMDDRSLPVGLQQQASGRPASDLPTNSFSADPPAPSIHDLTSGTISTVASPQPPESPFAPFSRIVDGPPDSSVAQHQPAQHSNLPKNLQVSPQPHRSAPAPGAAAKKQDETWQRFLNKLEDIKAKLDDFDESTLTPEVNSPQDQECKATIPMLCRWIESASKCKSLACMAVVLV